MVFIGCISYSLYLWHWTVLSVSRWTVGIHWWSVPFQISLMLLLAIWSYGCVERPLRHAKWSSIHWKSIAYGASACVAAAAWLMLLINPLGERVYFGKRTTMDTDQFSAVLSKNSHNETKGLLKTCNMSPQQLSGSAYQPKPLIDANYIQNCVQSPNRKLLLVGDSFAEVAAPHLEVLAKKLGYDFRMIFGYGCPYPLPYSMLGSPALEKCPEVDEALLYREVTHCLNAGEYFGDSSVPSEVPIYKLYGKCPTISDCLRYCLSFACAHYQSERRKALYHRREPHLDAVQLGLDKSAVVQRSIGRY